MKREWPLYLGTQLCNLAFVINALFAPIFLMLITDALTELSDRSRLWSALQTILLFGASILVLVQLLFRFAAWGQAHLLSRMNSNVLLTLFCHLQRHNVTYFQTHSPGALANRLTMLHSRLPSIFLHIMDGLIPFFVTLMILLILYAKIYPLFAWLLLAGIILQTLLSIPLLNYCKRSAERYMHHFIRLINCMSDSLSNYLNVKLFARQLHEYQLVTQAQGIELEYNIRMEMADRYTRFLMNLFSVLFFYIGMSWFVLARWQQGMSTGDLIFLLNGTWNISAMLKNTIARLPATSSAIGQSKNVIALLQTKPATVDLPDASLLQVSQGTITVEGLSFTYTSKEKKIQLQIDQLKIPGKQVVGLVGHSGSGKTTFVNLLVRHFGPQKGVISIDGQDIAKVTQESLRQQISMISQETTFFHSTLLDNLKLGKWDATEAEVIEACQLARCHDFIVKLPRGYHTIMKERGSMLSMGERQRIAIARALLMDKPIVILDEATSGLDALTEKAIEQDVELLTEGRTLLLITHRLAILQKVERVLVFDGGKIVEDGNYDELLQHKGYFHKLWSMQGSGFLP